MRISSLFFRKKQTLLKTLPFIAVSFTLWLIFRDGLPGEGSSDAAGDEYFGEQANAAATSALPFSLETLADVVQQNNERQTVANQGRFGALGAHDPVLVVQVHNRGQYLAALIESLRKVDGIERALVIFSHDLFDVKINAIISKISFCKVS